MSVSGTRVRSVPTRWPPVRAMCGCLSKQGEGEGERERENERERETEGDRHR